MNDFYADYKSGLFDNSFRQAILGSPVEQQNLVRLYAFHANDQHVVLDSEDQTLTQDCHHAGARSASILREGRTQRSDIRSREGSPSGFGERGETSEEKHPA